MRCRSSRPADRSFQHSANILSVDRKIRRHVDRKSGFAIQSLREHFEDILQARLDAPAKPLGPTQELWFGLLEEALASAGPADERRSSNKVDKPAVSISVVKAANM